MPIIQILNFPTGPDRPYEHLTELAALLKQACVEARIHGIESTDVVTVIENGRRLDPEDRTVILKVEGLFEKPERTAEGRARLAKMLVHCAHGYYGGHEKVEVFVHRFDPAVEAYAEIGRSAPVTAAKG